MKLCQFWGAGVMFSACYNNIEDPSSSLISLLSSDGNYSSFLNQLQRADLVDFVNELQNVTLLAYRNSAFDNILNGFLLPALPTIDKDDLLKLIIDQPVWEHNVNGTVIFDTLLTAYGDNNQSLPLHVPILMKRNIENETWFVENSHVVDQLYSPTTNSRLLGIDLPLQDPKLPICSYFKTSLDRDTGPRKFTKFANLVSSFGSCEQLGLRNGNLTVLIPSDNSLDIDVYNSIELDYLYSLEGSKDRNQYLSNYFIDGMIGGNLFDDSVQSFDQNGKELIVRSKYNGDVISLTFNHGASQVESTQANYLLNDAILHYFENDLFIYTNRFDVEWTPRKYLIGLHQHSFVNEIDFKNLGYLIDDLKSEQTIFITNSNESTIGITNQMKNQLLYHFSDKLDALSDKNPHLLLDSQRCIDGNCQKIRIELKDDTLIVNDNSLITSCPVCIGGTTIYTIDNDFELPMEFKVAVARKVTGYARSTNLINKIGLKGLQTIFLPNTATWDELGLVWKFLKSNPEKLSLILKALVLNTAIYSDFSGVIETTNMLGEKIIVQSLDGEHLRLIYHKSDGTPFEYDIANKWETEILYDDGVVHTLPSPIHYELTPENLPLSPSFNITLTDLLSTQNYAEFNKILEKLNLEHVLEPKNGYSILLPPTKSLLRDSVLSWDTKKLQKLISFHVLPPGSIDKIMHCNETEYISTLDPSLNLNCRVLSGGEIMLSIADGSDRETRVLQHGFSFPIQSQGIMTLDKFIDPDWMDNKGGIHLHLSLLAILFGIIIGIMMAIFLVGVCLVFTVGNKKADEDPDSGNDINERARPLASVNEQMPLLNDNNGNTTNSIPKRNILLKSKSARVLGVKIDDKQEARTFSSEYSAHAKSHPVTIGSAPPHHR